MKGINGEYMKNNRWEALFWFLLGAFIFRWIIDVGDILIQKIANGHTVASAKSQFELNKLMSEDNGGSTQAIGFEIPQYEEYYEEEEYE